jgi:hypothetical protein
MRARQLGITLGLGTPGEFNAITDVPGVRVGHSTLKTRIDGKPVRTGVSLIQPRPGGAAAAVLAGCHVLNGNGDATGLGMDQRSRPADHADRHHQHPQRRRGARCADRPSANAWRTRRCTGACRW